MTTARRAGRRLRWIAVCVLAMGVAGAVAGCNSQRSGTEPVRGGR